MHFRVVRHGPTPALGQVCRFEVRSSTWDALLFSALADQGPQEEGQVGQALGKGDGPTGA
jgi:hypothetical protein